MKRKEDLNFQIKIKKRASLYGGTFEFDNLFSANKTSRADKF